MLGNLPGLDPFSWTWRGLAASHALRQPCPLVKGEVALGPWPSIGHALFGTSWWWSSMEWLRRLTPTKEPRCGVIGAPQPYSSPPCSPLKRTVLCLRPFFASWPPSWPLHPLSLLAPSFSSSNWVWGVGWW